LKKGQLKGPYDFLIIVNKPHRKDS